MYALVHPAVGGPGEGGGIDAQKVEEEAGVRAPSADFASLAKGARAVFE